MPIYEYTCESCEEELEVIQKISDEPLTQCPSCHNQSLKKKTSMSAFHLKGGGWYKDGYGDSNSKASTNGATVDNKKAKPGDSSTTSASPEKKDSSKAAAKTDSNTSKAASTSPKSKAS